MLPYRSANRLRMQDFQVKLEDRPGWVRGTTRLPIAGEDVYCAAGEGTVTALHGKTGNGSRLVQIGLASTPKHPFYAAASNVLLAPAGGVDAAAHTQLIGIPTPTEAEPWLGGSWTDARLG